MGIVRHIIEHAILGIKKGTGGTGTSIVKDESIIISSNVSKWNFIGDDVIANMDSFITGQCNVYIPAPILPPYFNTGTALVPDAITYDRYVSSPTAEGNPFKVGSWNLSNLHPCINSSIQYSTGGHCRFDTDNTTIEVNIYDADEVTVINNHTTPAISGNYDATSSNIRIQVTDWTVVVPGYQANISVTINTSLILPNSGRFTVEITHHNNSDYSKVQGPMFYDSNPALPGINGCSITENTVISSKYLSGIRYYDETDTFDIVISSLTGLNGDSYPGNLVIVNSWGEYGISNTYLMGSDLDSWSNIHNVGTCSYFETLSIVRDDFRYIGIAANISAQVHDWIPEGTINSSDMLICIDTWDQQSTYLSEYFTDEIFRRTSGNVVWDSTINMLSYDDNAGLMVQDGKLLTMRTNWELYRPGLSSNSDYSPFTGWGTYYRRFIDSSSQVRGSCTMNISGFTLQNLIDEDVKIWLYIPGKWTSECYVHGTSTFDFGTFNGDNDPIRVASSTTYNINISFGNLGLDSSHNYFIMHLEILSSSIQPDSIVVSF